MIEQLRDLDKTDKEILKFIQANLHELTVPDDVIETLSEMVGKSTEVIESRITKLRRLGLMDAQTGLDIRDIEVKLARIDLFAMKVDEIISKLEKCPAISNIFRITGDYNVTLVMAAPSAAIIEKFVDTCLRPEKNIIKINTTYIIDSLKKTVVPIILDLDMLEGDMCFTNCGNRTLVEAVRESKKKSS